MFIRAVRVTAVKSTVTDLVLRDADTAHGAFELSVLTEPALTVLLVPAVRTVTVSVTPGHQTDTGGPGPALSPGLPGRAGQSGLVDLTLRPGLVTLHGHSSRGHQASLVISGRAVEAAVTDLLVQDTSPPTPALGHATGTPLTRLRPLVCSVLSEHF